jgi:hypothetical protein
VAIAALVLLGSSLGLLPATASSDPKEEKRIEALEQQFFSQTYKSDSDDARLARVEDMLFNHARSGSTDERLASLEDALSSIKSSTKAPAMNNSTTSGNTGSSGSVAGNDSRYRHFADMDDQNSDGDGFDSPASNFYNQASPGTSQMPQASSAGAKSGTLVTQQLAAMETQIFGKPNLKMPLLNRVKKLEQNVLSSGSDTSNLSLPDRIKNLWSNLNPSSATTGNGIKSKATGATATEDTTPSTTSMRKRPQAKADEDDVSEDQAMAEYLQKLKKDSSANANVQANGKRASRNANKSGWLDDSEMPSKGLDPAYSSDDDNPPIVIGGNSSMSNMQAQGSVQNFSSGMGINMGTPNQMSNPGLFTKLGQAIGGAVNGANNPYGYGSPGGIYGGYPNVMPYGYGGISPYGAGLPYGGISPYGGYGGLSPYGGYGMSPPVMGPPLGGIGSYGNVSPYGSGGPRAGNPYGINPYAASPQPYGYGGVIRR